MKRLIIVSIQLAIIMFGIVMALQFIAKEDARLKQARKTKEKIDFCQTYYDEDCVILCIEVKEQEMSDEVN